MTLLFCRCCNAMSRELDDGRCWNCTHDRCDVCAEKACERCEEVDADGDDQLCSPCRTIRENAAEQAWIDHETDKFFGGGR